MKLYWDYENHLLFYYSTSASILSRIDVTLRDQVPVELYLMAYDVVSGTYTICEAPAGHGVVMGLKYKTGLAGNVLAQIDTTGWTESGTGETKKYAGTLNLNTTDLIAAVAANEDADTKTLDMWAELTLRNTTTSADRDSTKIVCGVAEDVNRESDIVPSTMNPQFQFFQRDDGAWCMRIITPDGDTLRTFEPP